MKISKSMSGKFALYAFLSMVGAIGGLFVIYYAATFIFRLPGTKNVYFYRAYQAVSIILKDTPWVLWLVIFVVLFMVVYWALSRRTIKRLNEVVKSVNQVAGGDYRLNITVKDNDVIGVLEHDVAEMARHIEEAFSMQKATEASKEAFIRDIAHDIRTPLMSLVGYLTFISEHSLDHELTRKYAGIAYEKSKRLEKLVEDLLDISNLVVGEMAINPSPIEIGRFLSQVADEAFPMVTEANMEIRLDYPKEPITISADGDLLARVFDNLITNAIRYAKSGIFIDITAGCLDNDEICISVVTHSNPIPDSELENIFNPMYRLDWARAADKGASGLGLSISRRIIEAHGGTLTAQRVGDGTGFFIWF